MHVSSIVLKIRVNTTQTQEHQVLVVLFQNTHPHQITEPPFLHFQGIDKVHRGARTYQLHYVFF
jgi:type IV secretory pathway VirD2 relaxase